MLNGLRHQHGVDFYFDPAISYKRGKLWANLPKPITTQTSTIIYSVTFFFFSIPILIISALVLGSLHSSAVDGSSADKVTLSIPVSCTMNTTINSEHTISMVAGTYKDNIGKTTLTTYCNDKDGYVIYVIGATNNIEGKNTLSSIDLDEDYDIVTGLNTSKPVSGEDVSNWAMKLIPVAGNYAPIIPVSYNNTYGLVPNTWTNVAHRDPGTFDMSEGSTFTTTYAVYAKGTQPASTYTGQVKYALLHPSSSISPTTLERAFFLAGKTKVDIVDPTTGETNSYYKMQDMTTNICNTANITGEASQVQLIDIRDNKTYWATKLLDGHCWMTQNLDLDLDSSVAFTSENTDLNVIYNSTTGEYPEYNVGYSQNSNTVFWLPKNSTVVSESSWTSSNMLSSSLDIGKYYLDSSIGDHSLTGNYYNWTSSIASNDSTSLTDDTYANPENNPKNSICPKGWRLPIITNYSNTEPGDNEFANLNYYYNGGKTNQISGLVSGPLYFVKAGMLWNNTSGIGYLTSFSNYWSSTVYSLSAAYLFNI